MRKFYFLLLLVFSIISFTAKAQIVISQVYGGGGNSGATYKNDFIELFNPTSSPVSLTGWTVQYASTTGTSWAKTDLSGSIPAHGYYLIQEAAGTGGTTSLSTPDATGTINLSGTVGKVALLNTNTVIVSGTSCPTGATVVDFVGFGTGTNCFEGTGPTPTLSNTTAALRANNGCTDTNNNASDFTAGSPNPRNSSSPINLCGASIAISAGSNPAAEPSTQGSFVIKFNTPTSASTIIDFAYTGSATFGSDYTVSYSAGTTTSTSSTGTLTVPSGVSTVTVTVTPIDDNLIERTENISLSLSNASGYAITTSSASINLLDDDLAVVSVAAGINASEPSTNGNFTINFNTPTTASTTLDFAFTGSATFGTDYSVSYSAGTTPSTTSTGTLTIPAGTSAVTVIITPIDDAVLEGTETINFSISNPSAPYILGTSSTNINLLDNEIPKIVINQVYGGGGNSGAVYKNDFVELYNDENIPISLSGWSVQYASATGSSWQTTALTGIIPAHGFYLIQEAQGSGGTTNLPTPDATGTIAMSATSGKVLLSNSTTALSGANPSGASVIDKIGYGSANGYETAPTDVLDNTTAAKRITDGVDTDNNSVDFTVTDPEPRNSPYTTTAPVIVSLAPPDNSSDVPYNISTSITFDKTIQKGTGNITIYENGIALPGIDVNSSIVTITNKRTVNINFTYSPAKSYYINIDAGAFKDAYGNNFAGINNSTSWNFTTASIGPFTLPVSFDFQNCTGTGLLPNGFTQFSQLGDLRWDCTAFGRDPGAPAGTTAFPNAVQMNGFANGTNVPNIDWLISPAIDLTGTTYPLLSFWSRIAFNGSPLQLKVSTDYPGTGDPNGYTWTDVNGKFPGQTSNIWTLSSGINLSAFKQSNVHFAFVYTSTNEDGARWTIDDISVINSSTPPPPSLTVGASDIQFNFVANGSTGDKTFTFIGNDLTNDVTLNITGPFLLSKDGVSYSSSLTYTVDEANNVNETVHVQFAPTQANQNFTGTATVTTGTLSGSINLEGTSIDPATTLEVVNWNMEWFGSTSLGPTNDDQQEQNAEIVLKNANADIYGLVEVVDESRLARIVSHMPGYSYIICNYGSHTNPFESGAGPLSEAQKEAFVYKTDMFSNISTTPLVTNGVNTAADLSNPAYNYFASGRYPFMMTADVNLNGVTKTIRFVLLHAKANTSPTLTAYARRKAGADTLKYTLNTNYPNDNILMLGDFNDDLDSTITDGIHPRITSYYSFTNDTVTTFYSPTLALSLAGKKSTVSYNDMIDHVMLSNEMKPWYMPGSASALSDVTSLVSNYGSTTSDHYPVFTRYQFCKLTCPGNISVSTDAGVCGATVTFTVGQTMTCGTVTAIPASGSFFPIGSSTVTVTASTGETCSFVVTVVDNQKPNVDCVSNQIKNTNNTNCTYQVNGTEFDPTYSDNCTVASVTNSYNHSSSLAGAMFPGGNTDVTWSVKDASGNESTCSYTVTVNSSLNVSLPATVWALQPDHSGTNANTIYIGYSPASALSITATATGGSGTYSYHWAVTSNLSIVSGANDQTVQITSSTPNASQYKVTVTVTDAYGCSVTTVKDVYVIDVRSGNKGNKASVCHRGNTLSIDPNDVPDHLAIGDQLGTCTTASIVSNSRLITSSNQSQLLSVQVLPNPTASYFTLSINSNNNAGAITVRVTDVFGRVIERRDAVSSGGTIQLGNSYLPGVYFAEVMQGDQKQQLKLIKQ